MRGKSWWLDGHFSELKNFPLFANLFFAGKLRGSNPDP
jgi:hypothetical protein